jgi:periplasmic protein TonB
MFSRNLLFAYFVFAVACTGQVLYGQDAQSLGEIARQNRAHQNGAPKDNGLAATPANINGLEPAQVLKRVPPVYLEIAKARRLSGSATVQGLVGKDGKISNLQLTSGLPVFRESVFQAMQQCQFKPARLNGQPIEQSIQLRFDFKPM